MSAEQSIQWRWEDGNQRRFELQRAQKFLPIANESVIQEGVIEAKAIR